MVPAPQHHHLPGWVRRTYAEVRPQLAELLTSLPEPALSEFRHELQKLTDGIAQGRFSLAWQYSALTERGNALREKYQQQAQEQAKQRHNFESRQKKLEQKLRVAAGTIAPENLNRLTRALRLAQSEVAIEELERELQTTMAEAQTSHDRKREREIARTKSRLQKTIPSTQDSRSPTEAWQDVLKRLASQSGIVGSDTKGDGAPTREAYLSDSS